MVAELIPSFFAGLGTSLAVGSPAEWAVHKYILHAPPKVRKRNKFIAGASLGHNDNHHGAYKGPAHYYRDITNEHEVIHFSKSDVGVIAGISAIIGAATTTTYSVIQDGDLDLDSSNAGYVAGIVTGAMAYYGCYEFIHHYMHVIGERRLGINRILGDQIQGSSNRDGNLRLSKPLLDDICNKIEYYIDQNVNREYTPQFLFDYPLIERLNLQIDQNHDTSRKTGITLPPARADALRVLEKTTRMSLEIAKKEKESLSTKEKVSYWFDRKIQSSLRERTFFKVLDNHHFLHHFKYLKNLNVVFPLMDILAGTKEDSSQKLLEEDTRFWLCPNSPDNVKFKRKPARVF